MNINELDSYNLADAVKFHRRLNPRIWGRDEHLLPEVRDKLLAIAADFQEFLGVDDLTVKDITISGSNAAYSYTKNSDIDLHLVVEMPDDPVYQELFNAKKYQYNDEHNIRIGGADVELYVQPADQTHHSLGIYSVKNGDWISIPQRKRAQIDDACVRDKVSDLDARIHSAIQSKDLGRISTLWDKIKVMRQSGLEQHGEFGCENIAFKLLRNKGCIGALKDAKTALQDLELSLREANRPQKRFRYGYGADTVAEASTPDGVSPTTCMFLNEDDEETLVHEFIQHVAMELGIDPVPEIHLHTDPEWSANNHSFGRYDPDSHTLNVSMPNRHVMDVLRTVAHELVHCSQNQQHGQLPDDAGETGSRWENDANARAGIIMRDWANSHPEHFELPALEESASGYIPKNKKEAKMPQYAMALSVDIKPGQVGKEANKLGLKTGRNGEPGLLQPDAENLLREFSEFVTEQENLFEISMSPTSLKKLSAQTGALAGMEFEMIVPGVKGEDQDQEPDYDYDERASSIDDICNFFYDGDFNGRRQIDDLRERLRDSYEQWADEQLNNDWSDQGIDYLYQYVKNNVDDETIIEALGLEPDEAGNEPVIGREQWAEYAQRSWEENNDTYDEALSEFRDEWYNDDSHEETWLDDEGINSMMDVENTYGGIVTWPHWSDPNAGETDVEQVADEFSHAIGREVRASENYHSGRVERPSTKSLHYIIEPDGSLDPDDSNDAGLEFVSPPLPIEELLSDLNKVKEWAGMYGCYTNASTGLHINVSVPGWDGDMNKLDYVKLAVLLGDEFVLDSFGRAGNTYAKSAMGKIRSIVKQNPAKAQELLQRMKLGMDQLASKAIHSGVTEKYTSINTKNGYIEFRSPGGDWLDDNFAEIENTLRRFTVALSAAVDPEMYRKEYLKKLYKLLDVSGEKDPLSYFAKYSAGELPKAALKSFVRQAQLERGVKRGKEEPQQEPQQEPQGVDTRVDYELYDRTTNAVIDTFPARNDDEAQVRLDDYRSWPGASNPDNFGVRRAGRPAATAPAPTAEQYYDVTWTDGGSESHMRVRAVTATGAMYMVRNHLQRQGIDAENIEAQVSRYQDAPGSTTDLQRQRAAQAPAPQPAGGEFTGNWLIRAEDGTVLHRFGGIGNSQADANRTALAWAQRNPDVMRQHFGGVDVVPEMNESLREYQMPQPSQGPGRYRDLNEPLGPEFPPTMPAGTVKVDVSDVYDWYKLGQHISNMKDLGQHDFGQGPPSAILSFGDEDLEHQYIQALKRTGLTTTDIDPVDPDQPPGMPRQKTDPTYNVDESQDSDTIDADQVLNYVKNTHAPEPFNIEYSITDHPAWELQNISLSELNLDPNGEQQDPYNRTNWVDYDVVRDLMPKIVQVLKSKPIVVDTEGWIIDGNHRAMAAVEAGLTSVPALVPADVNENFADGKNPGRKGLSKRVGVNTKASVSSLRKTAKNSSGEKQRMAHWLANMKAGRAKAKKK